MNTKEYRVSKLNIIRQLKWSIPVWIFCTFVGFSYSQGAVSSSSACAVELARAEMLEVQESCSQHAACSLFLEYASSCASKIEFLGKIKVQIGEGTGLIFKDKDVKTRHVWQAILPSKLGIPPDQTETLENLDALEDKLSSVRQVLTSPSDLKSKWIFYGDSKEPEPTGVGILFEIDGQTWKIQKGNFKGLSVNGFGDSLRFNGSVITRQVSTYVNSTIVPQALVLTMDTTGLLMLGKFDSSLLLFNGTIRMADGSTMVGQYQPKTGDGQLSIYRVDGTLKEKGEYRNNQLFSGEIFDQTGKPTQKIDHYAALAKQEADKKQAEQLAQQQAELLHQQKLLEDKRLQQVADEKFRKQLAELNPGQLFILADEWLAKKDAMKAREALKALVARFPDHGLAVGAANMLTTLRNSQPLQTANDANQVAGLPAKLECEPALKQLSQLQADRKDKGLNRSPIARYREQVVFSYERVNVAKQWCSGTEQGSKYIHEAQLAFEAARQACILLAADETQCNSLP